MILITTVWLLKSLVILGIFHLALPTVVNATTGNSWAKLPLMILLGLMAGIFMAWLHYVPYLLFFLWLALNKYTLAAMLESKFEHESQMRINKPLFYVSSYSYIVIACAFAWLIQVEICRGIDPMGPCAPLWKHLLVME